MGDSCLIQLGVSHRTAPLEVREAMALDRDRLDELRRALKAEESISGFCLVSTCNRFEIYAVGVGPGAADRLVEVYGNLAGCSAGHLRRYTFLRHELEVLRHLMSVCCGLDSEMIGETEVLGQVKASYQQASDAGDLSPALHKSFQKSFQAAKWVRTNTTIGQGQVSLGNVAVDLALRIFGKLTVCRVLVVGAGQVGTDTTNAFKNRGASCVSVTGRSPEKVHKLARAIGASTFPFDDWRQRLTHFDVIICSTAAPGFILHHKDVKTAMRKRPDQPLFIIDLAVPRDVESEVGHISNVYLYTFSDIAEVSNENRKSRLKEADRARFELSQRAERLWPSIEYLVQKQASVSSPS